MVLSDEIGASTSCSVLQIFMPNRVTQVTYEPSHDAYKTGYNDQNHIFKISYGYRFFRT